MPVFKYRAKDSSGKLVSSTIEAPSLNIALENLQAARLKVLHIEKHRFDLLYQLKQLERVKQQSLVMFTRRISAMLNSGITISRALQVLSQQESDEKLKYILTQIFQWVMTGKSFSAALVKYPEVFNGLYVSMVRMGEATGHLGAMLERLGDFLERDYRIKRQVASALTYPAFVLVTCLLVVWGIFVFVLPKIIGIFTQSHMPLPLSTRIIIFIIGALSNPYVVLAGLGLLAYYIYNFRRLLKTPEGKYRFDSFVLRLPIAGDLNRKILTANFCRGMGIMLASAVPLTHSMEILMEFMGNEYFKNKICEPVYRMIQNGKAIASTIESTGFFPKMVTNLIAVGETTGELPTMFSKISHFYDEEVLYAVESCLSLLEPVMVAGLGIVVGFVLQATFMPIYQMVSNL